MMAARAPSIEVPDTTQVSRVTSADISFVYTEKEGRRKGSRKRVGNLGGNGVQ